MPNSLAMSWALTTGCRTSKSAIFQLAASRRAFMGCCHPDHREQTLFARPGVSGCRRDGDRPSAARPSGGAPRPGIEPGARSQSGNGRHPVPGRYEGTVVHIEKLTGILFVSQGAAVIVRRGLRAPSARGSRHWSGAREKRCVPSSLSSTHEASNGRTRNRQHSRPQFMKGADRPLPTGLPREGLPTKPHPDKNPYCVIVTA